VNNESPVRYGFRTVWREPFLALAEVVWRWSWGTATLLIAGFAGRNFLQSLHVSGGDEMKLRTGNPQLAAEVILRIFNGSGPTMLRLALIIAPSALVLWALAATLGRAATLRALVGNHRPLLGRTFFLHAWRVAIGVLTFIGIVASYVLAAILAYDRPTPQPLLMIVIFFPIAVVFTILRSRINWLLLLANIYVALGRKSSEAFGLATRVFKRRSSDFMGVGTIVGLIRLFLIVVVTVLSFVLLAGVGTAPPKLLWLGFILLTLVYFALSDWLYVVKLAAYARIIEQDTTIPAAVPAVAVAPVPEPARP